MGVCHCRSPGESAGTGAEVGHPKVHGRVAGGHVAHDGELLLGDDKAGLDRGDLAAN